MKNWLRTPATAAVRPGPYRRQLPAIVSSLRMRTLKGLPWSGLPFSTMASPYVAEMVGLKDTSNVPPPVSATVAGNSTLCASDSMSTTLAVTLARSEKLRPNWSRTVTVALYGSSTKPCPLYRSTVDSVSLGLGCWHGTRKGLPATAEGPTESVTLYSPLIGATYVTSRVPSSASDTSGFTIADPRIESFRSDALSCFAGDSADTVKEVGTFGAANTSPGPVAS
mmetsp:Transcript_7157/g.20974  ORF Transcript_7157/g.20974 Transcript_7157/m.20974 type:complete len:224 (+) Transcript_7157:7057-7728(+)